MNGIQHLVVSVPANNEEGSLSRCLTSVGAAVEALRARRPDIAATVCVGLDRCTDRSEDVVGEHGALSVRADTPGVGAARDAAIERGLRELAVTDLEGAWLACTDADTVVEPDWLLRHVMWAEQGLHLVVGTVEPHGELDAAVVALWHDRHDLVEDHSHVHGANLGIRGSHWRLAGGSATSRSTRTPASSPGSGLEPSGGSPPTPCGCAPQGVSAVASTEGSQRSSPASIR